DLKQHLRRLVVDTNGDGVMALRLGDYRELLGDTSELLRDANMLGSVIKAIGSNNFSLGDGYGTIHDVTTVQGGIHGEFWQNGDAHRQGGGAEVNMGEGARHKKPLSDAEKGMKGDAIGIGAKIKEIVLEGMKKGGANWEDNTSCMQEGGAKCIDSGSVCMQKGGTYVALAPFALVRLVLFALVRLVLDDANETLGGTKALGDAVAMDGAHFVGDVGQRSGGGESPCNEGDTQKAGWRGLGSAIILGGINLSFGYGRHRLGIFGDDRRRLGGSSDIRHRSGRARGLAMRPLEGVAILDFLFLTPSRH
ncbi:unnamed protein product, partial [Ilex paraguariensis]